MQNGSDTSKYCKWDPLSVLLRNSPTQYSRIALLILNQPLDEEECTFIKAAWPKAVLRVTVDGGTEELHKAFKDNAHKLIPDYITGDFDSLTKETRAYYESKGSTCIHTPDQDDTDFTKALWVVKDIQEKKNIKVDAAVAVCKFSGRLDQILSCLNTLYLAANKLSIPVYLFSGDSVAWLLSSGKHIIKVPCDFKDLWCGLVPVGSPCTRVSTKGLKWNLNNEKMHFGGLISTSNTYDGSGLVTVDTDESLIWMMAVR